jgi:hypothetical protein
MPGDPRATNTPQAATRPTTAISTPSRTRGCPGTSSSAATINTEPNSTSVPASRDTIHGILMIRVMLMEAATTSRPARAVQAATCASAKLSQVAVR